jgi:hypothetical protein
MTVQLSDFPQSNSFVNRFRWQLSTSLARIDECAHSGDGEANGVLAIHGHIGRFRGGRVDYWTV